MTNSNTALLETVTSTKPSWKEVLAGEKSKPYFAELMKFVEQERANGKTIYPKNSEVFNALHRTSFEFLKVVILGQDPYHGAGQAHGLSFSVRKGVPAPPSLKNIFKELGTDLEIPTPEHGCLENWADQGVLLLNSVLTVEAGNAGSHANKGWEQFTDQVISQINAHKAGVVFLLWGSYAIKKGAFVDKKKHLVLTAPHPSPLSAHRGFLGCRHFSKANQYLKKAGKTSIDWALD